LIAAMRTRASAGAGSPRRRRFLIALLILPFVAGLFAAPAASPVAGDELAEAKAQQAAIEKKIAEQKRLIAELNTSQSRMQARIAATSSELKGITADLTATRKRVDALTSEIAVVQASYESLVVELATLDGELVEIEAQEVQKLKDLGERRRQLAQRIREAYDAGRTSMLETLLSGAQFTDVLAEMSYQMDVADQDRALAQRIAQDRETLIALHRTVELTRTQTNSLRQETAVQKAALDARMEELKEAQARLAVLEAETKKSLAAQKAAYAKLSKDAAALKKALAASASAKQKLQNKIDDLVARQYQLGNIPSVYNGSLRWPMSGSISGEFGCSPFPFYGPGNGCAHFHNGIDIVAPYGTPVKAAGAGRVVYIGWNYADGSDPAWIVIIAHSQDLSTWYAHMQPRYPGGIGAGSVVAAGQVIGYEGNTGKTTGAHLHWMVQYNGKFVNPRLFV
jgi:murein DD-endopeptidase MepM/ murein hydrolase activator NlpD